MVGSVSVETKLVGDPEADEKGDGHTGGEACDINKAIAFALNQMAPGEEEVVSKHVFNLSIPPNCRE